MRLAFCLFKYFPYGGLQRDSLRIAQACRALGHEVHFYTTQWDGDRAEFPVHLIKPKGWQNHVRFKSYVVQVQQQLKKEAPDLIVGFNKMPGLDVYYAADVCLQAKVKEKHGFLYRLTPRYRQWKAFEAAVFNPNQHTLILSIAPVQQAYFIEYYGTEKSRFYPLPPGITADRSRPTDALNIRKQLREENNLDEDAYVLLMVGSGFKAKGLDRAIKALASLPARLRERTALWIVGKDNPQVFQRLAKHLDVEQQIQFLGGRFDVPELLLAADILIHPAYHENTGTVLLEALIAGLPVLTVDVCGYAPYIQLAEAGLVLSSPFQQSALDQALEQMLTSSNHAIWQKNALSFAKTADIYSMAEKAAAIISAARKPMISIANP